MAERSGGIPGIALAMATAGGFLLYIGIRNVPLLEGLRSMLKGEVPTPRPKKEVVVPAVFSGGGGAAGGEAGLPGLGQTNASSEGTLLGRQILQSALKYRGEPYFWGGAVPRSAGGPGLDCSGFVTWVLHHDLGLNLPSNSHTVTQQFLAWGGSTQIPRDKCAAGDLVCWVEHMGIATSNTEMIHAPTAGDVVKISNIWSLPPPVIRRVNIQSSL